MSGRRLRAARPCIRIMALEAPKPTVLAEDGRDSLDDTGGHEIPGPAPGQLASRDHPGVAPSPGRFAQRRLVATAAALGEPPWRRGEYRRHCGPEPADPASLRRLALTPGLPDAGADEHPPVLHP